MVKKLVLTATLLAGIHATQKFYSLTEVSKHRSASDCWLAIDGEVYDVTGYIERHRKYDYDITRHCGTDSTAGWSEKPESGKPHSRKAERLLGKYRIGSLIK